MARYDKYDPISGGFRAKLAADLTLVAGSIGPIAVTCDDVLGRVQPGALATKGVLGVLVKNTPQAPTYGQNMALGTSTSVGALAGDVVDVMTAGEIVDVVIAGCTPGKRVYANATTGVLQSTATAFPVGWMLDAGRLLVRVACVPIA